MLDQAIFEFEELSLCIQEDLDDELYGHASVFEAMVKTLQVLLKDLQGRGEFSDRIELQIIPQVNQLHLIIPFCLLVAAIDSA